MSKCRFKKSSHGTSFSWLSNRCNIDLNLKAIYKNVLRCLHLIRGYSLIPCCLITNFLECFAMLVCKHHTSHLFSCFSNWVSHPVKWVWHSCCYTGQWHCLFQSISDLQNEPKLIRLTVQSSKVQQSNSFKCRWKICIVGFFASFD